MPRLSRGCLRCRQRKVRCDEGRPCCQRCVARNEVCVGYRDESDLIFRNETDKVIGSSLYSGGGGQIVSPPMTAPAQIYIDTQPGTALLHVETLRTSPRLSSIHQVQGRQRQRSSSVVPNRRGHGLLSPSATQIPLGLSARALPLYPFESGYEAKYFPWLNNIALPLQPPPLSKPEENAVQAFFAKYTLLPHDFAPLNDGRTNSKNHGHLRASQGFLEFLPCTFEEVNLRGRLALRWAVQAAALANAASEVTFHDKPNDMMTAPGSGARLNLYQCSLEYYGKALLALSKSLGEHGKVPDDYDLMTVVILDLFESLFAPDAVSRGCHAQGMSQILRTRGHEQLYDARGWSLFRLAHHRLQKQSLAFNSTPAAVSEEMLGYLNEEMSFVKLSKDANRISEICARGRSLRDQLQSDRTDSSAADLLSLVREMQALDRDAVGWRKSPEWAYATLKTSDLHGDSAVLSQFPDFVQIHPDIWTAYEWNYHRCSRIILHKQLLACLHRATTLNIDGAENVASLLPQLKSESIAIIQHLTTDILATVPQMLGDVDHTGQVRKVDLPLPQCRAIGAYFLLWPIKILKGDLSEMIAKEQRQSAADVMARIREYTGMKSLLGDASII